MIALLLSAHLALAKDTTPPAYQPDLSDPQVKLDTQLRILDTLVGSGMAPQALDMVHTMRSEGTTDVRLDVVEARAMSAVGMQKEALTQLQEVVKTHRRDASAWAALGVLYADEKDLPSAVAALEKAERLDPKDAKIHNNLGWLYLSQGKTDASLRELREAVKLDPASATDRNNLGFALMRAEKDPEALQAFRAAAATDGGGEAQARYNMGVACEQRGEPESAIVNYQAALQAQPDHPLAKAALARLLNPEAS